MNKFTAILSAVSATGLVMACLLVPGLARAQTYLGDVCWEALTDNNDEDDENDIVKLAVQLVGEENIIINGFVIDTDRPEQAPQILFGGGTIHNGQAVMAMTGTVNDDEASGTLSIGVQLALDTLAGPFMMTGTVYDKQGEQFLNVVQEGSLSPIACP